MYPNFTPHHFDINSQNNVIFLSIALTFSGAIPSCESVREVHASEPTIEKQQPLKERSFEMNPQCSRYQTRLV